MGKKSHRRLVNHERGHSGCMSGLIGIFDFRHARSTRKLLSDKRHGSSRHAAAADTAILRSGLKLSRNSGKKHRRKDTNADDFSDGDEREELMVGSNKTSVKKLLEEDMSNEQQTDMQVPNAAREQLQSGPDYEGNAEKNHKQTKETCKDVCDDTGVSIAMESLEYYQTNSAKRLSLLDITSLMEEFCSQIQQHQEIWCHNESGGDSCGALVCTDMGKHEQLGELDMHKTAKHSVLQEKLSEAAVTFLNQKLIDTKQFKEDGAIHQSKQFMDALEILNSNKELLLKFLLDSNSSGMKYIREVQDICSPVEKAKQEKLIGAKSQKGIGSSERGKEPACRKEVQKHNIHNFFRKKDKSQKRNSSEKSDCSQVSNRIVVLKPTTTGNQNSSTANTPISSPGSHYTLKDQGWGGRLNSQFSLGEIKKKLKNTMGENRKDRQWFFMDGMLHKIPNKHQVSGSNGNTHPDNSGGKDVESKISAHAPSNRSEEKKIEKPKPSHPRTAHEVASTSAASPRNPTITSGRYPKQRETNIYLEAKKHLEELLTGVDEDGGFPNEKSPKTLGKILSLPDYTSSPLWSPGVDGEHGFITAQMRLSSNGSFRIVNENIWRFKLDKNPSQPSPSRNNLEIQQGDDGDNNSDIIIKEIDSTTDSPEGALGDTGICESICSKEDSVPKGNVQSMEETDIVSLEEEHLQDTPSEVNNTTSTISTSTTTKVSEKEECTKCLRLNSSEDDQQPSSSSCSLSSNSLQLQKVGSLENINDLPERPSPVSVLEPFYDDVYSPTAGRPHAELLIERLHFEDEDDNCATMVITSSDLHNHPEQCMEDNIPPFEYVAAVLQASSMKWCQLSEKNNFSELLLSSSLFDEVEHVHRQDCGDRKLLFDCTNEVLTELYKRYYGSSSWVAFVHPDIRPAPIGNNIIQEVWEGINWNLTPPLMPHTLDQIIGKDMEKSRTWMDLRSDVEVIGNEMVDVILEEIVDSLIDLCN